MQKLHLKIVHHLKKCRTEINETFVDDAEHINIAMPMYNLIEYSDNYSDTSGSLWQFKSDEIEGDVDLTNNNCHHLSINQVLLVILMQMKQIEKKKV